MLLERKKKGKEESIREEEGMKRSRGRKDARKEERAGEWNLDEGYRRAKEGKEEQERRMENEEEK